jgi:hypothetical protein
MTANRPAYTARRTARVLPVDPRLDLAALEVGRSPAGPEVRVFGRPPLPYLATTMSEALSACPKPVPRCPSLVETGVRLCVSAFVMRLMSEEIHGTDV